MRQRYRTATQLAIARGDPLPPMDQGEYWGLGGFSAWTANGADRFGVPGMEGRRSGAKTWVRVPVLEEAEVEDEKGVEWDDMRVSRCFGESNLTL